MGDVNQKLFLTRAVSQVVGPILEVGSKDYGNTTSFRDAFGGNEYLGVDLSEGKGVDRVIDLTAGIGDLPQGHFALAICCSVLEHVRRPWLMAENLTRVVRPAGALYIAVPWVWRYHAYPDDYFRFSPRAVQSLFPSFSWRHATYSSTVPGEHLDLDLANFKEVDNSLAQNAQTPNGARKYLPYLMVNMLGEKRPT